MLHSRIYHASCTASNTHPLSNYFSFSHRRLLQYELLHHRPRRENLPSRGRRALKLNLVVLVLYFVLLVYLYC